MTRLMQSVSALTLAAALAVTPMLAVAQQAVESDAEQAVEAAAQETKEAAGAAAEAVGEAAEQAGQSLEQAGDTAGQAVEATAREVAGGTQGTEAEVIVREPTPGTISVTTEDGTRTIDGGTAGATAVTTETTGTAETTGTTEGVVIVEGEAELEETQQVEQVQGTIRLQDENSVLSSDLVGATVFNPANEKIGEIDDAILSLDGTVEGVVIGVGGFLGLGEKKVAIEMQQLSVQTDGDGQPQLFLDTTKEALESAPEFVTAADQRDQADTMQAGQTPPAEGGMMTSDPTPMPTEQSGQVTVPAQN